MKTTQTILNVVKTLIILLMIPFICKWRGNIKKAQESADGMDRCLDSIKVYTKSGDASVKKYNDSFNYFFQQQRFFNHTPSLNPLSKNQFKTIQ